MAGKTAEESWPEFMEHLKAVQEGRESPEDDEASSQPKYSYFLVDTRGELHLKHGSLRDKFVAISEGYGAAGESGTEWTNLYPLAAYDFVRFGIPEDRRLNTVANALMWELTGPLELYRPTGEDGTADAVPATLIVIDATAAEIIEWRADEAADQAREKAQRDIERVRAGKGSFTLPWAEALERNAANGGTLTPGAE